MIEDAVLYTDGGGKVRSALRPIYGKSRIYAFLRELFQREAFPAALCQSISTTKGRLIMKTTARLTRFALLGIRKAIPSNVFIVSNPDKLKHIKI
ncbi:hypothetical protein PO124_01730 [Bacillus licheniformis]|nr:hypothetical protein [Bacillus licheniformis]